MIEKRERELRMQREKYSLQNGWKIEEIKKINLIGNTNKDGEKILK